MKRGKTDWLAYYSSWTYGLMVSEYTRLTAKWPYSEEEAARAAVLSRLIVELRDSAQRAMRGAH